MLGTQIFIKIKADFMSFMTTAQLVKYPQVKIEIMNDFLTKANPWRIYCFERLFYIGILFA